MPPEFEPVFTHPPESSATADAARIVPVLEPSERIVVVDPRSSVRRLFELLGYEEDLDVMTASHVHDALCKVRGLAREPKALLTAWRLPEMTGEDLVRMLRECRLLKPSTPVFQIVDADDESGASVPARHLATPSTLGNLRRQMREIDLIAPSHPRDGKRERETKQDARPVGD